MVCCIPAFGDLNINTPCGLMDNKPCGPIGQYAKAFTTCCGGGTGMVNCDSGLVALTHTLCPNPYSCMQHFGWSGWKRNEGDDEGDESMYAHCEKVD
jgi:hypothetical protein